MKITSFILGMLESQYKTLNTILDGLTHDELTWRPGPESNPIGFIFWHMTRDEDYTQAMIRQQPQEWIHDKWYEKFKMSDNPDEDGYGYTADQVAAFIAPELDDLFKYSKNTRNQTINLLKNLPDEEIDRIIKTPYWGDRSIGSLYYSGFLPEVLQHTGHIAYLRGLQRGLDK